MRDISGSDIKSDKIHFYPFTSIVIALGGFTQYPTDPADDNYGTFKLAIELYKQGYDVHMYNENDVNVVGEGVAYNEVVRAIEKRKVYNVAILGYSHGGGATYLLATNLYFDTIFSPYLSLTIPFTAYIDAVAKQSESDTTAEWRRPKGTEYLLNYYQVGSTADEFLDGGPISDLQNVIDHEFNVDEFGPKHTHFTIDDEPNVLNRIKSELTNRVNE